MGRHRVGHGSDGGGPRGLRPRATSWRLPIWPDVSPLSLADLIRQRRAGGRRQVSVSTGRHDRSGVGFKPIEQAQWARCKNRHQKYSQHKCIDIAAFQPLAELSLIEGLSSEVRRRIFATGLMVRRHDQHLSSNTNLMKQRLMHCLLVIVSCTV